IESGETILQRRLSDESPAAQKAIEVIVNDELTLRLFVTESATIDDARLQLVEEVASCWRSDRE
ncbi:MAG: hypothetical protein KDA33_10555, partial [Phycisphaerales bacterium]|nr:hypothetical protein [Phycisphaerales bacterium]